MIKQLTYVLLFILLWLPAITYGEQYGENQPDNLYSIQSLWHLNDNSSTESDASGNGNTGTVSGATYITTGRFGGAYSFDGGNDTIQINTLTGFDGNAGSISLWGYDANTSKSTYAYLLSIRYDTATRIRIYVDASDNLLFYRRAGGSTDEISTTQWSLNTWHSVVVTWDVSGSTMCLFLDGELIASDAVSGPWSGTPVTNDIGSYYTGAYYWEGTIDEVVIYNRVLSAVEIRQNYAKQKGAYSIHE